MDNQEHKSSRPNFLSRGPGLLGSLLDAWYNAAEKLGLVKTNSSPEAAAYKVEAPFERHHN